MFKIYFVSKHLWGLFKFTHLGIVLAEGAEAGRNYNYRCWGRHPTDTPNHWSSTPHSPREQFSTISIYFYTITLESIPEGHILMDKLLNWSRWILIKYLYFIPSPYCWTSHAAAGISHITAPVIDCWLKQLSTLYHQTTWTGPDKIYDTSTQ